MLAKLRISMLSVGFFAVACGSGGPSAADLSGTDDDTENLYSRVTWLFQCPALPLPVPTPGANELVLVDAGPHQYSREKLFTVPFTVKGKLCPAERLNRDAIFVVDISASMAGNDPLIPDPADATRQTCGRYEAYKAVMANIPAATGNFAVVTFGSGVQRSSSRMFTTQAELEADISQNGTLQLVQNVFCENPSGTNYAPALERARQLFTVSRQYATKEVYFLTDGSPSDTAAAVQKATELKTVGVPINGQNKLITIATVMLWTGTSTPPTLLQDQIASRDTNNVPIHANAANAADLARILDGMTDNQLAGSEIRHGGTSSPNPTVIDLMPMVDPTTLEFQLPTSALNIDLASNEYQMRFKYWDTNRNTFEIIGRLAWTDRN